VAEFNGLVSKGSAFLPTLFNFINQCIKVLNKVSDAQVSDTTKAKLKYKSLVQNKYELNFRATIKLLLRRTLVLQQFFAAYRNYK